MAASGNIPYGPNRKFWRLSLDKMAVIEELLVSLPSSDPLKEAGYTKVPGITSIKYQVPSLGLTQEEHDIVMEETGGVLRCGYKLLLGFQGSEGFECSHCLQTPLTNIGM